jgi:hypothetical protein
MCNETFITLSLTIRFVEKNVSNMIMFNLDYFNMRLSHQLTFQIQVMVGGRNIHNTILDKGSSTCFISLSCWRAIGSPKLNQYPTTLKVFDGHGFHPHGVLQYFIVELKGKNASIYIEVVDALLYYNLFLGHNWLCAMIVVAYSVFRILQFPHQVKIVTLDQLDYCTPDLHASPKSNVPFLGHSNLEYESLGVCLLKYSSLMGFFPLSPLDTPKVSTLNMISTQVQQPLESLDPLVVPSIYDHNSSSLSRLLKNETNPPAFELILPLDRILESSFSPPISSLSSFPYGEHIPISIQKSK